MTVGNGRVEEDNMVVVRKHGRWMQMESAFGYLVLLLGQSNLIFGAKSKGQIDLVNTQI